MSSNSVSKTKLLTLLNAFSFRRVSVRQLLLSFAPEKHRSIVVRLSIMKVPQAPIVKSKGKSPSRLTAHSDTTEIFN